MAFELNWVNYVTPLLYLAFERKPVSDNLIMDQVVEGKVVKKTLKESSEWKTPNAGSHVSLRLEGRLLDGTVFEQRGEGQELEFVIDEGTHTPPPSTEI